MCKKRHGHKAVIWLLPSLFFLQRLNTWKTLGGNPLKINLQTGTTVLWTVLKQWTWKLNQILRPNFKEILKPANRVCNSSYNTTSGIRTLHSRKAFYDYSYTPVQHTTSVLERKSNECRNTKKWKVPQQRTLLQNSRQTVTRMNDRQYRQT